MVSKSKGIKVVYHAENLSALAIANFAISIGSDVTVGKAPQPNVNRHEFFHVELKPNPADPKQVINGELAIMDFIAARQNRESAGGNGVSL